MEIGLQISSTCSGGPSTLEKPVFGAGSHTQIRLATVIIVDRCKLVQHDTDSTSIGP